MNPPKMVLGDCRDVLKSFSDESVHLYFFDPPYGQTENGSLQQRREAVLSWQDGNGVYRDTNAHGKLVKNDGKEADALFYDILSNITRTLTVDGVVCACAGGGGPDPMFARWTRWLQKHLHFKMMVVWDKGKMGMGWHYRRSYEVVLVAVKDPAKAQWFDTTNKIENIIRTGDYGIKKIIPSEDQHPTEKPWQLPAHFIKLHTKPGDVVCDPFAGSGSTGEAAIRGGREFIGIELDEQHYTKAVARLDRVTEQMKHTIFSPPIKRKKGKKQKNFPRLF